MSCLIWYGWKTRCAADQFINCVAFDELRDIWSIAQPTCNRVKVKIRTSVRVWVSFRVSVMLRLAQLANAQRVWLNAQRVWSNAQI